MRLPPRGPQPYPPGLGWVVCVLRGYPFRGSPLRSPAVRRRGVTALMWAAMKGDAEIIQKLVDARADLNTQNSEGCAFPARRGVGGGRWSPMRRVRLAGKQRCTWRRSTAAPTPPCGCSSAAPARSSRTTAGNAVPPTAKRHRTPIAPIGAGRRLAKSHKNATSSPSTMRRWRRCGRGIAPPHARALLLPARRARPQATHALPQHCMPRRRAWAYAEAPGLAACQLLCIA